jgi:DeoR family transcriptional regulator of aga operon
MTPTKKITSPKPRADGQEMADAGMLIGQRHRRISELVGQRGKITVAELAQMFGISQVKARNDLNALAETGAVVRTRGGALAQSDTGDSIRAR